MNNIAQNSFLSELENQLENQIQFVTKYIQNLSEYSLLVSNSSHSWSIAQSIEHLNTYGVYYLPHLNSILERGIETQCANYYKPSILGNYFTKKIAPQTGTKKLKAHKKHLPNASLSPHKIIAQHLKYQELLYTFLTKAHRLDLNKNKVPISIAPIIKLSLGDILRFIIAHNNRHLIQVSNNLPSNISVKFNSVA